MWLYSQHFPSSHSPRSQHGMASHQSRHCEADRCARAWLGGEGQTWGRSLSSPLCPPSPISCHHSALHSWRVQRQALPAQLSRCFNARCAIPHTDRYPPMLPSWVAANFLIRTTDKKHIRTRRVPLQGVCYAVAQTKPRTESDGKGMNLATHKIKERKNNA